MTGMFVFRTNAQSVVPCNDACQYRTSKKEAEPSYIPQSESCGCVVALGRIHCRCA